MLDNYRSMAIFATVVNRGSFSAAARDLNITTSAVSQQVSSLEQELGVILLHRSTRKLSLTEAGQVFYESCREMIEAAQRGRIHLYELRDELVGELRIATTPEIAANHLVPALSDWLAQNPGLRVNFLADNHYIDMIEQRVDIAIRMTSNLADTSLLARRRMTVKMLKVASPSYLAQANAIETPRDLRQHRQIGLTLMRDYQVWNLSRDDQTETVTLPSSMLTNNVFLAKSLAAKGHGLLRLLDIDLREELQQQTLVPILPDWHLPTFEIYAVTIQRERQPLKVSKCIDALHDYFAQLEPV